MYVTAHAQASGAERQVWMVAAALMLLGLSSYELRYAMYLVAAIGIAYIAKTGRLRQPGPAAPFLLYLVAGIITLPLTNVHGAKDLLFVLSGIIIFLAARVPEVQNIHAKLLLSFAFVGIVRVYSDGGISEIQFSLAEVTSSFEGVSAFLCGLIAVVAIRMKRKMLLFFSLCLALLFLKRAALLGVLVCMSASLLPERILDRLLRPIPMALVNALLLVVALLYSVGGLNDVIFDLTSQSANQFGMGRQMLQEAVASEMVGDYEKFLFWGHGVGAAYPLFYGKFGGGDVNLHSDAMKIAFELGLVFFMVFIALGYKVKSLSARVLFLYTNVILFTDNLLIYTFYLLFLMTAQICVARQESARPGG